MKKKVLALLLCAVMTASLAACGDNDEQPSNQGNNQENQQQQENDQQQQQEEVTPEALPDAFAHITFDEGANEGYTVVKQVDDGSVAPPDGGTFAIVESSDVLGYADGPVGQALYLDGKHGLNLNLEATNTDTWTVSYWVNADRLGTFGPTLCMGHSIGRAAGAGNNVTWFNITQAEWGGENSDNGKIFPVVWSRNEASIAQDGTDFWPWMYAWDDAIHGKKEWVMITLASSGEKQIGPDGVTTCGAQLYINGSLVYDSADNYENGTYFDYTWDASLAPNIMQPGSAEFESWFGINYWDIVFRGFVDDLYVFNTTLTPGQVASLYALGNPNVTSVAPETVEAEPEPEEPVAVDHSDVLITGTLVGAKDYSTAWWTAFSDIKAVPNGESVTVNFVNWSNQLENWFNFLVVLQNVDGAHSADDNADYKEYAVVRADNFGWGAGYEGIATATCDWVWETMKSDIDGATVELTVTNNGDTADVVAVVTTLNGTVYNQSYTGIAIDGDLYFCLTVDGSFIDLQ